MDALTFASSVISSLAWPLAAILAVVILRRPVSDFIGALGRRLRSVRFPGGEAFFAEELDQLKEAADEARFPAPTEAVGDYGAAVQRWKILAQTSPDAVVLEAWRQIEGVLREHAEISEREKRSPLAMVRALGKRGILDSDTIAILGDLRSLRNAVVHGQGPGVTPGDAVEYAVVARRVLARLRSVLNQ